MATESCRLEIQDWARFLSFSPSLYFKPANRDELTSFLQGIVQGFAGAKRVRTLGSLHSCSDIYVSDATVDVSGMHENNEFILVGDTITASANWKLHDFLLELSRHGKSLSATGGADEQTLAGLISTNTAPATPKHAIYDLLEWVEYITVDEGGRTIVEKHVSKDDPVFPAVVCSLGAIGILTRVQFRVIDELFFQTVQKIIPLDDVLRDVDTTSRDYDFWRIDWIPETSRGLLWAAKQVPRDQAAPNGDYKQDEVESILRECSCFGTSSVVTLALCWMTR